MVELFKVGHFSIYLFGVTIAIGMLVGFLIMLHEAKRKKMEVEKLFDIGIYTILASLIGARLYYVIAFNFEYYVSHPIKILSVRDGGLSIQGGIIFGIAFATWYTKKHNLDFWKAADAFAPGIIIGQAIGRIGCDVFGVPMSKYYPWGVVVNSQLVHPVQIYEALLDMALFMFLWRRKYKIRYNGQLFMEYIIGFSLIRFIVEFFRSNPIVLGPLTIAHVTSIFIIGIALICNARIKAKNARTENYLDNTSIKNSRIFYLLIIAFGIISTWIYYYIH